MISVLSLIFVVARERSIEAKFQGQHSWCGSPGFQFQRVKHGIYLLYKAQKSIFYEGKG